MTDMSDHQILQNYPATELLQQTPLSLVITDPNLPDNPIVFINKAFEQTTGYSKSVSIGHNCRFLQGRDTDPKAVARIRDAVTEEQETVITILNYRADGEPFWNELNIGPIYDKNDKLVYFLGIQKLVPSPDGKSSESVSRDLMLQEIQHRVKNHLSMVVSLIRSQARAEHTSGEEGYTTLARRVEALQLLYEQLNVSSDRFDTVDIGAYAGQVVAAVSHLNTTPGIRVNIDADAAEVSVDLAVQVGLILSEVLTNALQHAFTERDRGIVKINLGTDKDKTLILRVCDDGVGMKNADQWPSAGGSGSHIVKGMVDFTDATVAVKADSSGTDISIHFPLTGTTTNA